MDEISLFPVPGESLHSKRVDALQAKCDDLIPGKIRVMCMKYEWKKSTGKANGKKRREWSAMVEDLQTGEQHIMLEGSILYSLKNTPESFGSTGGTSSTEDTKEKISATTTNMRLGKHSSWEEKYQESYDRLVPGRYKVLSAVPRIATVMDLERQVEFTYNVAKALGKLAKNQDYIFSPTLEERAERGDFLPYISSLEIKVVEWLRSIGVECEQQAVIPSHFQQAVIPDILIRDPAVVIECDGLRYHCDAVKEDNHYHAKKLHDYEAAGYRALFFRGDEIRDKWEVVQSIILNALGRPAHRVYARDTVIQQVSEDFFEQNHLMGCGSKKTGIGLFHEGQCVAGITWALERKNTNEWKIDRFCSRLNTSVPGGFSKLVKHFIRSRNPESISTLVDLRYGRGKYLKGFGFENVGRNRPTYKWVDLGKKTTLPRLSFLNDDGYEDGFFKIWDCGTAKFVWRKS